jgi:uncharacterized membrane protein YfcA
MEELLKLLLLFCVGSLAGFINVMAGGGSTITLPTLIFLGLDSSLANGTNRVAILIQNISGILSFKIFLEYYPSGRKNITNLR